MTNRVDYQRMRPGESKKCLALVASRAAMGGRTKSVKAPKAKGAKS